MRAAYDGRQVVGIDLHRRRSVLVRMTESGERLETVGIDNDPLAFGLEIAKAGANPEVVLEATYGWCWAADVLAEAGATVHLAHPLGVKAVAYRRVKNDARDAADLADLLRMGRLPEASVAPPAVRQLRGLVRHRAKLVALRSGLQASVPAVLAKQGVQVATSDVFGVGGRTLLAGVPLDGAFRGRVDSLCRLIDAIDFEIDAVAGPLRARLAGHRGSTAVQAIPGVGRVLAAVFVAEIGQVDRFSRPEQLASWAGLTPRHRECDAIRPPWTNHQAGIHPGPLGGDRGGPLRRPRRLAAHYPHPHRRTPRPHHRHRRGGPQAAHPRLLRPTRRAPPRPEPSRGSVVSGSDVTGREVVLCLTPGCSRRGRPLD
jgi:transposase